MRIKIELTQEQIDLIGWGLLILYNDTLSEEKQETLELATDAMKKLNPNVIYDFG